MENFLIKIVEKELNLLFYVRKMLARVSHAHIPTTKLSGSSPHSLGEFVLRAFIVSWKERNLGSKNVFHVALEPAI